MHGRGMVVGERSRSTGPVTTCAQGFRRTSTVVIADIDYLGPFLSTFLSLFKLQLRSSGLDPKILVDLELWHVLFALSSVTLPLVHTTIQLVDCFVGDGRSMLANRATRW